MGEETNERQRLRKNGKVYIPVPLSEVKSLSRVRLFSTPWTVAYQAPPSMGFSRQEYCSGLPFLLQGIFPTQELNLGLSHCRQTLCRLSHQGSLSDALFLPLKGTHPDQAAGSGSGERGGARGRCHGWTGDGRGQAAVRQAWAAGLRHPLPRQERSEGVNPISQG